MPRRKKKVAPRILYPSPGPLPVKLAGQFAGRLLVFSDASQRRHGGLAAVLFADPADEPLVSRRTVPLDGSNELELQAALFALAELERQFPGRQASLFSDNQDAVNRLQRAVTLGLAQDPALALLCAEQGVAATLARTGIHWIRSHATCRGNLLADQHAAAAASGEAPQVSKQ